MSAAGRGPEATGRHRRIDASPETGRHRAVQAPPAPEPEHGRHAAPSRTSTARRAPQRLIAAGALVCMSVAPVLARSASGLGMHDAVAAEIAADPGQAEDTLDELSRGGALVGAAALSVTPDLISATSLPDSTAGALLAGTGTGSSASAPPAAGSTEPGSPEPGSPEVGTTGPEPVPMTAQSASPTGAATSSPDTTAPRSGDAQTATPTAAATSPTGAPEDGDAAPSSAPDVEEPEVTEPEVPEPEVTEPEVTEPQVTTAEPTRERKTREPRRSREKERDSAPDTDAAGSEPLSGTSTPTTAGSTAPTTAASTLDAVLEDLAGTFGG